MSAGHGALPIPTRDARASPELRRESAMGGQSSGESAQVPQVVTFPLDLLQGDSSRDRPERAVSALPAGELIRGLAG